MSYRQSILALSPGAYWRMNELTGNLADSAGGNTMTAAGSPGYGVPGAIDGGKGVSFPNNAATYFQAANHASIAVVDTFTIMAWVKPAAVGLGCIYTGVTNGPDFRLDAANKLSLVKSFVGAVHTANTALPAGVWSFVAVTKDGVDSTKFYLNGALDSGADTGGVAIEATAGVFQIGRNAQGASVPFNGAISEVAVIKGVAATAAQLLLAYQIGLAGGDDRRRRR